MKKNLIQAIIITSGITIISFKYKINYFTDLLDSLFFPVLIISFLIFIGGIIYYNTTKSFHISTKNVVVEHANNNTHFVSKTPLSVLAYLKETSGNFYLVTFAIAILISNLLGYKFKKLNTNEYKYELLNIQPKWRYDAYVDSIYSQYSFFHLKTVFSDGKEMVIFYYNWEVFFLSLFVIAGISIFIRNTIYYDKLLALFKKIKR